MCIYDRAPKFDVNWQIIDWTALTDKANGNAIKSFFLKKRIFKICRKRRAMAMTEAVSLAAAARSRIRSIGRRGAARLVAWAGNEKWSPWLAAGFVLLPPMLCTVLLTPLAGAQPPLC